MPRKSISFIKKDSDKLYTTPGLLMNLFCKLFQVPLQFVLLSDTTVKRRVHTLIQQQQQQEQSEEMGKQLLRELITS